MKYPNKYKVNQAINLMRNKIDLGQPLRWVYIYGHHRGRTTYMAKQYLKVSTRGTGDWMMYQFSEAIIAAENRERQTLNIKKLKKDFRKNLLANAHIGWSSIMILL
jgi:hypothetical protein